MKAVILAGGFGTRLSEETNTRPKPMVEIGGMPILWHIMKKYSFYGIKDFVICCGYKQEYIKQYFRNYQNIMADVTLGLASGEVRIHNHLAEPWNVTLVDTGLNTMTGGRLKNILPHIEKCDDVCVTYGDGVADINISELLAFHKYHGKLATVTSVVPEARFGALDIHPDTHRVESFIEKPIGEAGRINGGYFVLKPKAIEKYVTEGDATVWEQNPLRNLSKDGELFAFYHDGFWRPMDTLRDKEKLEDLWQSGKAPWKVWL